MTRKIVALLGIALAIGAGVAFGAQDKYTLQVPNGLAFSDFRGYEDWQVVSVSQTDELLKAMVANPVMIDAYKAGVPGNGKPFPDGSKIAKIEWKLKKSTEAPFSVNVQGNRVKKSTPNETCQVVVVPRSDKSAGLHGIFFAGRF